MTTVNQLVVATASAIPLRASFLCRTYEAGRLERPPIREVQTGRSPCLHAVVRPTGAPTLEQEGCHGHLDESTATMPLLLDTGAIVERLAEQQQHSLRFGSHGVHVHERARHAPTHATRQSWEGSLMGCLIFGQPCTSRPKGCTRFPGLPHGVVGDDKSY